MTKDGFGYLEFRRSSVDSMVRVFFMRDIMNVRNEGLRRMTSGFTHRARARLHVHVRGVCLLFLHFPGHFIRAFSDGPTVFRERRQSANRASCVFFVFVNF